MIRDTQASTNIICPTRDIHGMARSLPEMAGVDVDIGHIGYPAVFVVVLVCTVVVHGEDGHVQPNAELVEVVVVERTYCRI